MIRHLDTIPRMGSSTEQDVGKATTVPVLLGALRKWWKLALPVGLLLAGVGVTVVLLTTQLQYKASALIKVQDTAPYVAFPSPEESRRFIDTQIETLRSPVVLEPVLAQPEIANLPELRNEASPIDWITNHIEVRCAGQSEIFKITVTAHHPVSATKIVNAVVHTFFELRSRDDAEQFQKDIDRLEDERERSNAQANQLRDTVQKLSGELGDPNRKADAAGQLQHQRDAFQSSLASIQAERQEYETQLQLFRDAHRVAADPPPAALERAVEERPTVQALKVEVVTLEGRLRALEAKLARPKSNSVYVDLEDQVQRGRELLAKLRREVAAEEKAVWRENETARCRQELADRTAQFQKLTRQEQILKDRLKKEGVVVDASDDRVEMIRRELDAKRSELTRSEQVLDLIAARITKLRTEQRAPARITMLKGAADASTPMRTISTQKFMIITLTLFCLPFGLAIGWEHLLQRVFDSSQLRAKLSPPLMAEVTRLPGGLRSIKKAAGNPLKQQQVHAFEESVESLRTRLMLSQQGRDPQVVAITSASGREGKTTLAVQLAASIARASGDCTLLIDADLRSSRIRRLFGVSKQHGLATVLARRVSLDEAIFPTDDPRIHLLPAGDVVANPHQLVGAGGFDGVLDELRQLYRHIVIDTPPLLDGSETLMIARAADACLLCAMRDKSRLSKVTDAWERLLAAGIHPMGAVLNGVTLREVAVQSASMVFRLTRPLASFFHLRGSNEESVS